MSSLGPTRVVRTQGCRTTWHGRDRITIVKFSPLRLNSALIKETMPRPNRQRTNFCPFRRKVDRQDKRKYTPYRVLTIGISADSVGAIPLGGSCGLSV